MNRTDAYRLRPNLCSSAIQLRYVLLTAWATAVTVTLTLAYRDRGDYVMLAEAGRIITGGSVNAVRGGVMHHFHGALSLYAVQPVYQLGPPALFLLGLLQKITPYHRSVAVAIIVICGVVSVRAVERTVLNLGSDPLVTARRVLAGGVIVLTGWAWLVEYMHVEDAIAITCIFGAAAVITRRRPWWIAALLIGFAVACKPWAVVALPLLLGLDRGRVKAATLAVVSAAAWWLPFVVAYPHTVAALTHLQGFVRPGSVPYLFGLYTEPSGLRLLEMGAGIALAVVAAWRRMWLLVPFAGFAGRIMFDPRFFHYYAAGPLVAALLWDLRSRRNLPAWTCLVTVVELTTVRLSGRWLGFLQLGLVVAVVARVVWGQRASPADGSAEIVSGSRVSGEVVPAVR